MRVLVSVILILAVSSAAAEVFFPTRVIRAKEIIGPTDVVQKRSDVLGALDVIGLEARVTLYPNRPIRNGDVGAPAIVERNQEVKLIYRTGGLQIVAVGRVLARGAVGEWVRVMNLGSRISVMGLVREDGWIEVN